MCRSVSYLLSSSVQKCVISFIFQCAEVYKIFYCPVCRNVSYLLFSSVQRCIKSSTILDIEIYPIFHPPRKQDVTSSGFKARDVPYLLSCTIQAIDISTYLLFSRTERCAFSSILQARDVHSISSVLQAREMYHTILQSREMYHIFYLSG